MNVQIAVTQPTYSASSPGASILGTHIHASTWRSTIQSIHRWATAGESRYVCLCNVHALVTARGNPMFGRVLEKAHIVVPDGMPVAWMMRHMGFPGQTRINGPDLMWHYCELAERMHEPVYLYGNTEDTLQRLEQKLSAAFPALLVAGRCSPPFRPSTPEEDLAIEQSINQSGAKVVFVSLGCPKQELWMAARVGKVNAVMIGVGAAFDYHAGTLLRAPVWMQQRGLEWLFRFYSEPGRLWRRYLLTNTVFLFCASRQLMAYRWRH